MSSQYALIASQWPDLHAEAVRVEKNSQVYESVLPGKMIFMAAHAGMRCEKKYSLVVNH